MSNYIIMQRRSAHGGRYGKYSKLALVELTPEAAASGIEPAMISTRCAGIASILEIIEPLNTGAHYPHGNCAASKAYRALAQRAEALNTEAGAAA
jgi:hypothetical protein